MKPTAAYLTSSQDHISASVTVNLMALGWARQRLGLRQSSGAVEDKGVSKAPEDWRSPKPRRPIGRFMDRLRSLSQGMN